MAVKAARETELTLEKNILIWSEVESFGSDELCCLVVNDSGQSEVLL